INKEDHTLGNVLRHQLLKDPAVLFSGYHIIHPLEFKFELRVQTDPNGTYTPEDALENAIKDLISECSHLEDLFQVK
ncbi:RNA polymerase Rpb3/Rpb11 dimerization domain-containing protein, partial [Sphaeroforma arctica JP610]